MRSDNENEISVDYEETVDCPTVVIVMKQITFKEYHYPQNINGA